MKKRVVAMLLTAVSTASVFGGCGNKGPKLPDYSGDERFEYFTYTSPTDGYYQVDDLTYYAGESFQTVERYKEMLDCGFTILYLNRSAAVYDDTVWEDSVPKKAMENAYTAGFRKIILVDYRINQIVQGHQETFDAGKATEGSPTYDPSYDKDPSHYVFADYDALDARIEEYMSMYCEMPGFAGIVLHDEPRMGNSVCFGQVYKSLYRVSEKLGVEDFFVHANFLPIGASSDHYGTACTLEHDDENKAEDCTLGYHDHEQMYRNYIKTFLYETGMNRISADSYLFRGYGMYSGFYPSVQVLREEATKSNAELSYCLQSYHGYNGAQLAFDRCDKSMMYLEMNSMVGFGASYFAYYTYMPHPENSSTGSKDVGDGSFINNKGEKNQVWYYARQLFKEMQEFAPVILNYDFKGAKFFTNSLVQFGLDGYFESHQEAVTKTTLTWDNSYEFEALDSLKLDNDIALVTELKDDENDLYMYMVQNVIDPRNSKVGRTNMNVEVSFGSEYTYVAEFDCGQLRYVKLEDGVYKNNLSAGYAVYLIPLR